PPRYTPLPYTTLFRSGEVRVRHRQAEEQRHDDEEQDRPHEAVEHREDARPAEMHGPRERRHERVLDRSLPALPGHGLRDELEDRSEEHTSELQSLAYL